MLPSQTIKQARVCGVPIVSIGTSDQYAVIPQLVKLINGNSPVIAYDLVRGLRPLNSQGQTAYAEILGDSDPSLFTNPISAVSAFTDKAPDKCILVVIGTQRLITDISFQQALCNFRDLGKSTARCIVLLSPIGGLTFPADLGTDILSIEDTPPDNDSRAVIIKDIHDSAELPPPDAKDLINSVSATRGLSAYATEQACALSISKSGLDQSELWKRWKQAINSTPGLTVDDSKSTLEDIGGLDNLKTFVRQIMDGRRRPSAVIRVEEIEKAMSGSGYGNGGLSDSSGTSQSILGELLTHMQETDSTGMIAVGPPGSGKSLASVAIGSAGNIPTITLNLGALKGSLVGQTEQNTRLALSTLKSLVGERAFWIATCNGLATLPPELRRRFRFGLWFFDLPNQEERESIWKIWLKRYPDVKGELPNDQSWTGAEIKTCVEIAYDLSISPIEAAKWIVPTAKASPEAIENLRKAAQGRYLSASKPGTYQMTDASLQSKGTRKFNA
jgi:hypothetical protein